MTEAILDISETLGYLIKQRDISEAALAREINVPRATINRLISGKTPDPRASTLSVIAEYFNISIDQLLGKQPLCLNNNQTVIENNNSSIPFIPWEQVKNWEQFIAQAKNDKSLPWLMLDSSIDQCKFALQVKGESMWPQFQENTILIIDSRPEKIKATKNRDFIIAYSKENEDILFRQLIVDGKYKFLKALNNLFPSIQLTEKDKIIGVVAQARNSYS